MKSTAGRLLEKLNKINEDLVSFEEVSQERVFQAFHNSGFRMNFDDEPKLAMKYRMAVRRLGYDLMITDNTELAVTDSKGNPVNNFTANKVLDDAAESELLYSDHSSMGKSDFPWDDKSKWNDSEDKWAGIDRRYL